MNSHPGQGTNLLSGIAPLASLLAVFLAALSSQAAALEIDRSAVTVSGISAGGIMAQQLHIAYPELYAGAGVIAGAPWGCAAGNLGRALSQCTRSGDNVPPAQELVATARELQAGGKVGDLALLEDDRLWLFHGTLDAAVAAEVSNGVWDFYAAFMPESQRVYVNDMAATHHFPTVNQGHACDGFASPYIGACDFDAAGQLLQHLYTGALDEPGTLAAGAVLEQRELPGAAAAGLNPSAWLYVPPSCPTTGCRLHVVLHGCSQAVDQVQEQFMRQTGYLRWAHSNGIVLAFPQVTASPFNPLACWDWWGYTGANYQQRDGAQVKVITDWVMDLGGW